MNNKMLVAFLTVWLTNVALLWLFASIIFQNNVVLGNERLSMLTSAVLSGLILTVLYSLVEPSVKASGMKVKSYGVMMALYLGVNVIGLWVIKRFADATGLGISSVLYVLMVAVLITAAQAGIVKYAIPRIK